MWRPADHHPGGPRWIGVGAVLALHAAAIAGLWSHRLLPASAEAGTVFVNFIAPPAPERKEERRPEPPKPGPAAKAPRSLPPANLQTLPAQSPVNTQGEAQASTPAVPVAAAAAVSAMPLAAGPVVLGAELSAACPDRPAPAYPALSRRKGESGNVVLRVELDEQGRVTDARVVTSSGHDRLDEAAMTAVKSWRCQPALRQGHPVRAVALQAFNFVLQGN